MFNLLAGMAHIFKFEEALHPRDSSGRFSVVSGGPASSMAEERNARTSTLGHLYHTAFGDNRELSKEMESAVARVSEKAAKGGESYRKHVTNLDDLDSGKTHRMAFSEERRKLHRELIQKVLGDITPYLPEDGAKPEVIFLGGRGGSGKSSFNKKEGKDSGVFSEKTHLLLDPDTVKEMMPEYKPEEAYLVHKESAYIFDRIVHAARSMKLNIVLDTTMKSPLKGMVRSFDKAGYDMQAHFMHLPPEAAAVRAMNRWQNEKNYEKEGRGRLVPSEVILGMVNNEKNFDAILPKMKSWSLWSNNRPRGLGPEKISDSTSYKAKKFEGYSLVLKNNPYHGPDGKFTSHSNAFFVSSWGKNSANLDSPNNKGKNTVAAHAQLAKVKGLSHVLGKHIRSGGTFSDAFGSKVLAQANLHAAGFKGYALHSVSNNSAGYRQSLDGALASAFASSHLTSKQKNLAGIPLTDEEAKAIEKSKEYDKAHYSKKMKATKIEELGNHLQTFMVSSTVKGINHPDTVKAGNKYNKAKAMALKHGASNDEVTNKVIAVSKVVNDTHEKSVSEVTAMLSKGHLESHVKQNPMHLNNALSDSIKNHASVLGDKTIDAIKTSTKAAFENDLADAKSKLADAYSAKASAIPGSKALYDKLFESVHSTYGPAAAAEGATLGMQLFEAKVSTGHKPIHDPVQLSASEKKTVGEVLTGVKPNADKPATTKEHASVASGGLKNKPKTKESAMDVAKAHGLQYYLLKQEKYPNASSSNPPKELADAHALYMESKKHYESLGGSPMEFSSISSSLKDQANKLVKSSNDQKQALFSTHTNAVSASAQKIKYEALTKAGAGEIKKSKEAHKGVVKEASAHLSKEQISDAMAHGEALAIAKHGKVLDAAKESVSSASSEFHAALLANKGLSSHPDVVAKASVLSGALKAAQTTLSGPEITKAKTAGKDIAKKNHEAMKKFSKLGKGTSALCASYDKNKETFVDRTYDEDFIAHGKSMVKKMTSEEHSVLNGYTGPEFRSTNRAVGAAGTAKMNGTEVAPLPDHIKERMAAMDSVFAKTTLGKNVALRRNMPQKYLWEQLGVSMSSLDKLTDADLAKFSGRIYKETAYSSTSTNLGFSSCFATEGSVSGKAKLSIRAGKDMPGILAQSISDHPGEDEVVLPRGTTYVIRKVSRMSGSNGFYFKFDVDMVGAFPDPL